MSLPGDDPFPNLKSKGRGRLHAGAGPAMPPRVRGCGSEGSAAACEVPCCAQLALLSQLILHSLLVIVLLHVWLVSFF